MARRAREKSSSGIYHVIMRGVNRQTIFEEDEDRVKFLSTLGRYKSKQKYELYGYALIEGDMGTGTVSHICNDYKYPVKDKHFLKETWKRDMGTGPEVHPKS